MYSLMIDMPLFAGNDAGTFCELQMLASDQQDDGVVVQVDELNDAEEASTELGCCSELFVCRQPLSRELLFGVGEEANEGEVDTGE